MRKILAVLNKIDENRTPAVDFYQAERTANTATFEKAFPEEGINVEVKGARKHFSRQDIIASKDRILGDINKLEDYIINVVAMPYPEFQRENPFARLQEMKKDLHPVIQGLNLSYLEAKVRLITAATNNRLIRAMAALQLYYNDNKSYPDSLSELSPSYISTIPKDYFSEADFLYGSNGSDFYLYSVGPDMRNDAGRITYDPTNGTISSGDIIGK